MAAPVRVTAAIAALLAVTGLVLLAAPTMFAQHDVYRRGEAVTVSGYELPLGWVFLAVGGVVVIAAAALAFGWLRRGRAIRVALGWLLGLCIVAALFGAGAIADGAITRADNEGGPPLTGAGVGVGTWAALAGAVVAGVGRRTARRQAERELIS